MDRALCSGYEPSFGLSRRSFLQRFGMGLGSLALCDLLGEGSAMAPHHAPRARRVIYLFQSGGPSQIDLLDPKPELQRRHGQELPASVRMGQRLTAMSGNQASLPMAGSPFAFGRHGQSGMAISELMPRVARMADRLCLVDPSTPRPSTTAPGSPSCRPARSSPGAPASGPGWATVWEPSTGTCPPSWSW